MIRGTVIGQCNIIKIISAHEKNKKENNEGVEGKVKPGRTLVEKSAVHSGAHYDNGGLGLYPRG